MQKQDNYRKVKDEIEKRRINAYATAEARNAELREASELIKAIDEELTKTGLMLFKTACAGGDIAPIRERNAELCRRRREAIVALGYPEDYTELKFTCPDCSDTGYIGTAMCHCMREALITENIRSSGMGRLIEKQSFENFDLSWYKDDPAIHRMMENNFKMAKKFAESFGTRPQNLLMIGTTGTGKTHISTSIAKAVIERGYEVLYDSAQNIVSAFETDRFKSGYGSYEPVADKYLECDLLILDDLGTEFVNQFTISCLYNLFNTRQNRGLSTIISTNLSADELTKKYEGRIYSRIVGSDYTILSFAGRDHRLFAPKQ
ncbi:MAG: ATP-binding protein [Clostridia bacterium]|nr:ATP-binding protein [Clostridia bacterium]